MKHVWISASQSIVAEHLFSVVYVNDVLAHFERNVCLDTAENVIGSSTRASGGVCWKFVRPTTLVYDVNVHGSIARIMQIYTVTKQRNINRWLALRYVKYLISYRGFLSGRHNNDLRFKISLFQAESSP